MPLGGRGRVRDPRDGRPRRPGDRPGRRDRSGPHRGQGPRDRGRTPGGRRCAAPPPPCATPADGGQPALGGRPGHGRATRPSATCPRTATRSPTRCAPRRTRSSSRRPRITAGSRRSASPSCRSRTDRPLRILTHCNTGPLACGQFGTALGVVQAAHNAGRPLHVWVDETRPYLQGARLTTWELAQAGVPHTLIPDVAAGHLMAQGEVDVVIVGADRIAANGDTANKVGTYTLAVLAARHGIPFYVAAPISSVDLATPDGDVIPIEERTGRRGRSRSGASASPRPTPRCATRRSTSRRPSSSPGSSPTRGSLRAPYASGLAEAVARRELRRSTAPGSPRSPRRRPPRSRDRPRRRRARLMATSPSAPAHDAVAAPDHRPSAAARASSPRIGCTPPTRSATSRSASSPGPAGAPRSTAIEMVAVGLEYTGPTPQPLFVMGRTDGIAAVLRDVIRPRAAYIAARAEMLPGHRAALPRRRRAADGPDVGRSGALPAVPGDRPAPAPRRDRRAQSAVPARVRLVAARRRPSPMASTTGCGSTAA